jgi:ferric-dicitrate binding protein FerR (iron transport regulator)
LKKENCDEFEELILNESFREMVEGTNQQSADFWKEWLVLHPEKKEEFENAVIVLKTLLNNRKIDVTTNKNDSLHKLMQQIDEEHVVPDKKVMNFNSVWLKIAAVGLLIFGISSLWNVFHVKDIKNQDVAYNEIIVPLGEKAQIILSDGTHVWINSDSKLRYPVQFGEISRDVTLVGEAFFDVVKKPGMTFIVNTQDVKVNVLGTAFNVKCYPGDKKTQTIVVRGEVKVEDIHGNSDPIIIKPNEMATIREVTSPGIQASHLSAITVNKVDPEGLVSWKDQLLVFAGETLEDLAVKMERWYNVNIKIEDADLKPERFTGKFVHNVTVYQVLEAIKITTPISFRVEKDTIIISKVKNI